MSNTVDPRLLRAVAGDSAALSELLEVSAPALRAALAGAIPPRWQALLSIDDVVQQTWADAFLHIDRFDPGGAATLTTWLTAIARRNLIDALRALEAEKRGGQRRRVDPDDTQTALHELLRDRGSRPSRVARRNEARDALDSALAQLPTEHRRVVQRFALEGRSAAEIAAELGRSEGAVYMLRARALRRLAELLGSASQFLSGGA